MVRRGWAAGAGRMDGTVVRGLDIRAGAVHGTADTATLAPADRLAASMADMSLVADFTVRPWRVADFTQRQRFMAADSGVDSTAVVASTADADNTS